MKGLNQVQLVGNLGGDPEMKYTPGGKAVTTFNMATSRKYRKDKESDNLTEETEWHTVVTWERLAEGVNQSLNKGSAVCVTGRLHYQKWEDDKGKHSRAVIIAGDVIYLDKPNGKHADEIADEQLVNDPPF